MAKKKKANPPAPLLSNLGEIIEMAPRKSKVEDDFFFGLQNFEDLYVICCITGALKNIRPNVKTVDMFKAFNPEANDIELGYYEKLAALIDNIYYSNLEKMEFETFGIQNIPKRADILKDKLKRLMPF